MKALLQRVSRASVTVNNSVVGHINAGVLVFLGIEAKDTQADAEKLLQKILKYRIFADADNKMNLSLAQTQGGLLVVSQFTLVAATNKGLRPSFSAGASPAQGELLYNYFVELAQEQHAQVATGRYGADMQVELLNDGPVTFLLET